MKPLVAVALTHFPKATAMAGATLSGVLGTVGVEMSGVATGNGPLAIGLVASASAIGGFLAALPAIIRARTESLKVETDSHESEHDKLVSRIYGAHDRERAAWLADRANIVQSRERVEAINAVLRRSKHEALSQVHYTLQWIRLVQTLATARDFTLPEFTCPDLSQVLREEDEAIQKICGVPTASTPPRVIPPATPMR